MQWLNSLPFKSAAEQPQLSQPVLVGEVFHPSDHFCGPSLDPLQQVHVFPVLRAPELDTILQVGSHQGRAEGQDHLPRLLATLLWMQPRIRLAFWAVSAHCWLMSSFSPISTPKSFSAGLLSITSSPTCIETEDCPDPGVEPCTWPC
ncbi:hypothetical protein QYF61_017125 [Mycteria americana]|uniref:Uncharacterized protein n=1 Tax=Mycteria americana TaxID=33587 RepID=A0AAN7NK33_MYCAM|nr:hypothetical protein QYF61_017125 [Mycteria americana]